MIILSHVIVMYCIFFLLLWCDDKQGRRKRVRGPGKKNSVPPPTRTDWLKIFALYRKDYLSVAERLWLCAKGLICTVDSNDTTQKDKNLCNIFRLRAPLGVGGPQ